MYQGNYNYGLEDENIVTSYRLHWNFLTGSGNLPLGNGQKRKAVNVIRQ